MREPLIVWAGYPEGFEPPRVGRLAGCDPGMHVTRIDKPSALGWQCYCGKHTHRAQIDLEGDLPIIIVTPEDPIRDDLGNFSRPVVDQEHYEQVRGVGGGVATGATRP